MHSRATLLVALAPALAAMTAAPFAPPVHTAFALVCHQMPARSFAWFGAPMPVCARCLGLYLGLAAATIFPLRLPRAVLVILTAANLFDWLFALAPNTPRCLLALAVAWSAASWLLASSERAAAN